MLILHDDTFRNVLRNVLSTRVTSVIDFSLEKLFEDSANGGAKLAERQEEILRQVYISCSLDIKWLIAAYHLQDDGNYFAINQWLIQRSRTSMIPDLGERYNFAGVSA